MTIESTQRTIGKGKTMSVEDIRKITCDGCGQTRTFVLGKDKRHEHKPWYGIVPDIDFRTVGQGVRPDPEPAVDESNYRIDACSAECAAKALTKRLPKLPDHLPPIKP